MIKIKNDIDNFVGALFQCDWAKFVFLDTDEKSQFKSTV